MKFFFANYGLPIVTPVKRAAVNCVKNKELSSIQRSIRQIMREIAMRPMPLPLQKKSAKTTRPPRHMTSKCQGAPINCKNR